MTNRNPQPASGSPLTAIAGSIVFAAISAGCTGTQPPLQPASPGICREAVVSPVSGFAECVLPRGAPVAAPPPRPDKT